MTTLPSMAATALFHGKADRAFALEGFVEEARQFAIGPYAAFLLKGQKAPRAERAAIRRSSRASPGCPSYLDRADLRVIDRALLQGTAARSRPHHRPARQPLHRQGL